MAEPTLTVDGFSVGDRVLLTTMEIEGTIAALWTDGSAYLRWAGGTTIACGTSVFAHADPERRKDSRP